MKKIFIFIFLFSCFFTTDAFCGKRNKSVKNVPNGSVEMQQTIDTPCPDVDTDKEFVTMGIAKGSLSHTNILQPLAITDAKIKILRKANATFIQWLESYLSGQGTVLPDEIKEKLQNNINAYIIFDFTQSCLRSSEMDLYGEVYVFVGLSANKKDVLTALLIGHSEELSEDEKQQINFDLDIFRSKIQEYIENSDL